MAVAFIDIALLLLGGLFGRLGDEHRRFSRQIALKFEQCNPCSSSTDRIAED
jgi:hypothetical protein